MWDKIILPAVFVMIWYFVSQHKSERELWFGYLLHTISDGSKGYLAGHPPGYTGSYKPFQTAHKWGEFLISGFYIIILVGFYTFLPAEAYPSRKLMLM